MSIKQSFLRIIVKNTFFIITCFYVFHWQYSSHSLWKGTCGGLRFREEDEAIWSWVFSVSYAWIDIEYSFSVSTLYHLCNVCILQCLALIYLQYNDEAIKWLREYLETLKFSSLVTAGRLLCHKGHIVINSLYGSCQTHKLLLATMSLNCTHLFQFLTVFKVCVVSYI